MSVNDAYESLPAFVTRVAGDFLRKGKVFLFFSETENTLRTATVGVMETAPPLPVPLTCAQQCDHAVFVRDVVQRLSSSKRDSVLCSGLSTDGSFTWLWPNAAVNMLMKPCWARLHALVGTELMDFLFRFCRIYVSLAPDTHNGPVMHVCGAPPSKAPAADMVRVRQRVFYDTKYRQYCGLDHDSILNNFRETGEKRFARHLCRHIFALDGNPSRLHKRYRGIILPLARMVRRYQKRLDFYFYLQHWCPLPKDRASTEWTLSDSCTQYSVFRFVWSCMNRLIPKSLWGSRDNKALSRKMVELFVRLKRFENFPVKAWAAKWKMKDCEWIPKRVAGNQYPAHQRMVLQWLEWLTKEVMMPLVRNHFYVTETAYSNHAVVYYRKPVWSALTNQQLGSYLSSGMFAESSVSGTVSLKLQVSRVRMIPKANQTMRLVTNMSAYSRSAQTVSNNFKLTPMFDAIQWELFENNKSFLLGSSVFNWSEAYARMHPFIVKHKKHGGPFYFVSVDVMRSFDSVNQKKLWSILEDLLQKVFSAEQYVVQKFQEESRYRTVVRPANKLQPLEQLLVNNVKRGKTVVDRASGSFFCTKDAMELLREHLFQNRVRINGHEYNQVQGVPQGSVFSSLLTCLYYAHMERRALQDLLNKKDSSLMCRLVDDSLFISTDFECARQFYARFEDAHGRIRTEYDVVLNVDKTQLKGTVNASFPTRNPCIKWAGLLIDTVRMEFYVDYSRYKQKHVGDMLTVSYDSKPGEKMHTKLKQSLQARCTPLLLDTDINRPVVVHINVYQMFLLGAMKFHCHACRLPEWNARFLCWLITDLISFLTKMVRTNASNSISSKNVECLGWHAFYVVLLRKQSKYQELVLPMVKHEIHARSSMMIGDLHEATQPETSAILLKDVHY